MSDEPIQLDTIVVQSREVQLRKVPGGPDRMFVQADGTGNVMVDFAVGKDEWGKALDLNEAQYEALRQEAFRKELADLEDIPTYAELYPPPGKGRGGGSTTPNGNTQGRVNGEAPATGKSADGSNAEVESETPAEEDTGDKLLDGLQLGLDVVGLIPVVGEIADLANAGISLARGDYAGAALSVVSAIPFAGWLGTAGKVGRRGAKAAGEASAKTVREAAEKKAREEAQKKAKDEAEKKAKDEAAKKPKEDAARDQNSGGKSKKNKTKEKGDCGEWLSKMDLFDQGFDNVVAIQNNSGHGVDLIGRNSRTGEVKVWEVKTTDGPTAGKLSEAQRKMGGARFTKDRLSRAARGEGNYSKLPQVRANALKATQWIKGAGQNVLYEKREVFIDDIDKGCMKHPLRKSKSKPWQ
ncbi:hypothetical protein [Pseudomonas aeruginosa]|uniref:hypothetical protein n=1 Tax=Pseudomonas aeruginosa TaxID=287 RepID=UPI00163BEC7D|nr:hypothetical protein [Pseudomonas aeruginosa]